MLKKYTLSAIIVFASTIFFTSCNTAGSGSQSSLKSDNLRIAVSKEKSNTSTTKYTSWLSRFSSNIDYVNLYPLGIDSALNLLKTCDGLLLTGGRDVFPGNYGKIYDTARCGSFDRYRDSLEFRLIDTAIALKLPIFGVCRGEQILNISQGGSLFIDIPTDLDTVVHHRFSDGKTAYHPVRIVEKTKLSKITAPTKQGDVVSNHHQGIERLGENLLIAAYASDGLPEAIEWKDTAGKGFLMAVQWHPEAMDSLNSLSSPLAKEFLQQAADYNKFN